jgi:hypothetical protein
MPLRGRTVPPCLSCAKGKLRRQYEQCADKDTGAKHDRGNGIYPTEPHGTSLQSNLSQCFERLRYRCGSGSGCIMVAAMQQPMATTSVIAIRETHISPLLCRYRRPRLHLNVEVRWLVPDVRSEANFTATPGTWRCTPHSYREHGRITRQKGPADEQTGD